MRISIKDYILREIGKRGRLTTAELVRAVGVSRQAAASHMRELLRAGKISKSGSTRAAVYHAPRRRHRSGKSTEPIRFTRSFQIEGLEEDRVYRDIRLKLGLDKCLSVAARESTEYGFTEMLNNAIDHSLSSRVRVEISLDGTMVEFRITDPGIGAFESVRRKWGFADHFEAAEHLLKGKVTTAPDRHTGQGIFFTSKIADQFAIESSRLRLLVDHQQDDVTLEEIRNRRGTLVRFTLKTQARRRLKDLFDAFTNDEYEFDRTHVVVKLSGRSGHFSRSEAKRLLWGLEKFQRIMLDFRDVKGIGQSFADEVFRVFQKRHPGAQLYPVRTNDAVAFMIRRAGKFDTK